MYSKEQIEKCLEDVGFRMSIRNRMLGLFSVSKEYSTRVTIARLDVIIQHKWQLRAIKDELGKVSGKLADIENEIQYSKMLQEVIEIN